MNRDAEGGNNVRHRYTAVSTNANAPSSSISRGVVPFTPEQRLYYKLKAAMICTVSLYLLHFVQLYHTILHSSHVNHTAFRIGLASSVAILGVKSYVELYAGKLQKKVVDYKNYRQTTHIILILLVVASIAFHVALWPVYGGWKTMGIMIGVGYGVLLQFCIVFPTWVQNLVGFVVCTFFLQEYL